MPAVQDRGAPRRRSRLADAVAPDLKEEFMPTFHSRAAVPTDHPERYAKQLVAHLGHRVEFTTEDTTSTATFGTGTGRVIVGDGVLSLEASAPDEESLSRVEHVLGSHLERFGQKNELAVTWERQR
jgi:uncharacterized protein